MSKKTQKHLSLRQRHGFVFWLVLFWVVVWMATFVLQFFDKSGVTVLALDFDTLLAIVTILTFIVSTYGANALSWLKIRYMQRGK